MAIDPSISLAVRPPVIAPLQIQTPLEKFAKIQTLRNLMTEGQSGQLGLQTKQLQLQQAQQAASDDEATRQAWLNVGGDLTKLPEALAGKVSNKTMLDVTKAVTDHQSRMAKLSTDQITNLQKHNDLIRGEGQALLSLKPEERPAAYLAARTRLAAAGIPESEMPPQYDESFALGALNRSMQTTQFLKREQDRRQDLLKMVPKTPEQWKVWYPTLPDEYQAVIKPEYSQEEYDRVRQINTKPTAAKDISPADAERADQIAAAIAEGRQPPTTQGLYHLGAPVRAALEKKGYNLGTAQLDWLATQQHLKALNSGQQLRFRQVVDQISSTTDQVEALYNRWKEIGTSTGFKDFNKAGLEASSHLPGEMGSVSNNLKALLADYTAELGQVYMGGNSPTDHGLKLAEQNLKAEWNPQTFGDALKRIRESIQIRGNSLKNTGAAGLSGTTPYGEAPPTAQPVAPAAASSGTGEAPAGSTPGLEVSQPGAEPKMVWIGPDGKKYYKAPPVKQQGAPPAKQQGAQAKTATVDQVKAYAKKHNISEAEARKAAEAEGFVIR